MLIFYHHHHHSTYLSYSTLSANSNIKTEIITSQMHLLLLTLLDNESENIKLQNSNNSQFFIMSICLSPW